jgi:DNA-binding PadR family transcriptional regulator
MNFDQDKVDEATLALLWLVMETDKYGTRAWKGFDWDTLNRLHEKGFISDPKSKAKSVIVTDEGVKRAEKLFEKMFGISE